MEYEERVFKGSAWVNSLNDLSQDQRWELAEVLEYKNDEFGVTARVLLQREKIESLL